MQYSLGIEMHPKGQDVARYASIQLSTSTGSILSFVWSKCLNIGIGNLLISLPEILTVFGEVTLYTVMGCCKTLKTLFHSGFSCSGCQVWGK